MPRARATPFRSFVGLHALVYVAQFYLFGYVAHGPRRVVKQPLLFVGLHQSEQVARLE